MRKHKIQVKICNARRYLFEESLNLLFPHCSQPYMVRVLRCDANVKQKGKTGSRNLNDRCLAKDVKRMIFTDEKEFTYEVARNIQNDRIYEGRKKEITIRNYYCCNKHYCKEKRHSPTRLYHETSTFTKKVMVSADVVTWNGKLTSTVLIRTK